MEFPSVTSIEDVLEPIAYPTFVDVQYEPPAPSVDDVDAEARRALRELPLGQVPDGGSVAVGLGSRGIHDAPRIAEAVLTALRDHGYDPVVVPAMGSHGGASAAGQRQTLETLDLGPDRHGCPIDARMDTVAISETDRGWPVQFAVAALEADAVLVINRVKPHTNFQGQIESGLCKMTAIGLGKRAGAALVHEAAVEHGYVDAIEDTLSVICEEVSFLGGVAIVENFYDRAARIEGVPAGVLPEAESVLLTEARELMATLPYETLDALIVDRLGKDISGTGMDTNVIGRTRVLGGSAPSTPTIDRIVVRDLTAETHGNGHGIGLADLTTVDVLDALDLEAMYTNALTSGSLQRDALPVALPTAELAIRAALQTAGAYEPDTARIAWIEDTLQLAQFRVSEALAAEDHDHLRTGARYRLVFDDGVPTFEPIGC
jgi:hypothetical protein